MLPNTQSCNSMTSCDGVHMLYQIPDPSETSIWTNTIWLEMWDAPWLTGPIDIDTSVSDTHTDCTVMWKMDGSGGNNHKIATADCADTNQYVCAFNCQQSELVGREDLIIIIIIIIIFLVVVVVVVVAATAVIL